MANYRIGLKIINSCYESLNKLLESYFVHKFLIRRFWQLVVVLKVNKWKNYQMSYSVGNKNIL